jgi:hypothetical protein
MTATAPEIEINVPMLRKYTEWVEEQEALDWPERQWLQSYWLTGPAAMSAAVAQATGKVMPCGTAYCMAGKIAADADPRYVTASFVDGVHCSTLAGQLLGLTPVAPGPGEGYHDPSHPYTNHPLFRASNTAATIREIAESLAGERL